MEKIYPKKMVCKKYRLLNLPLVATIINIIQNEYPGLYEEISDAIKNNYLNKFEIYRKYCDFIGNIVSVMENNFGETDEYICSDEYFYVYETLIKLKNGEMKTVEKLFIEDFDIVDEKISSTCRSDTKN